MASSLAASQNIAAGIARGVCASRLVRGGGRAAVVPPIRAVSTASGGTSLGDIIADIASVSGASRALTSLVPPKNERLRDVGRGG